jgi:hypothetical protein
MHAATIDFDARSAPETRDPTFSPLDEQRQESMADEGGVSGAIMDAGLRPPVEQAPSKRPARVAKVALGLLLGGLAAALLFRKFPLR